MFALRIMTEYLFPCSSSIQDFDSDADDTASPTREGFGNYVGQATLKYDCEGNSKFREISKFPSTYKWSVGHNDKFSSLTGNDQGCISGKAGEDFYVLEVDNDGSGWTAVVSSDGSRQGFLPTTHLSITLYWKMFAFCLFSRSYPLRQGFEIYNFSDDYHLDLVPHSRFLRFDYSFFLSYKRILPTTYCH